MVGVILLFVAAMMALPLLISLYYREGDTPALMWSIIITVVVGVVLFIQGRKSRDLSLRDGFAVVTFGWLAMGFAGALPFFLSGAIPTFTDCMFESMSGFTTTGASILGSSVTIESLPHGVLFWRSLTQWIGGMGIILLSLAILPLLGVGGMQLYRAEFPGPVKDKLTPRIRDTAEILWFVYVFISLTEFLLLWAGGMSKFDAACHTFCTLATAGFSTHSESIAYYNNSYIHYVIIVFMFIGGTSFTLHYHLLKGKIGNFWNSREFRLYVSFILVFTIILIISNIIRNQFDSFEETFRQSLFNVVAIITTTGYSTADWEAWGEFTQVLMVMLMLIGGMAGSTGSGPKVIRIQIVLYQIKIELKRLIHPNAVLPMRIGGVVVNEGIVRNVLAFFLVFGLFLITSTAILTVMDIDIVTAFGASIACLANIGPGIGDVGATDNYGHLPAAAKWLLAMLMILGRLEIFTVLVLFSKHFWRR